MRPTVIVAGSAATLISTRSKRVAMPGVPVSPRPAPTVAVNAVTTGCLSLIVSPVMPGRKARPPASALIAWASRSTRFATASVSVLVKAPGG